MNFRRQKQEKLLRILKIAKLVEFCNKKNKSRLWSQQWLLRRDALSLGACAFVTNELLQEDERSYENWLRMDNRMFEKLHSMIEHKIKKQDTHFRQCIPSKFRLMVTLRYLATGESFKSLSYSSRIAACTISTFVPEVLSAIYEELLETYLKVPSTPQEWETIAYHFYNLWNVPNTIGAMDGKHITFKAPRSAGSHYYNYKGTHSIVLLAIVDANYNFIYIDVGSNGRVGDAGVYDGCDFATALNRQTLNLPNNKPLPGMEEPIPYVMLADAAFPLQEHILKPFPFKNMTKEERIYNYRLSRGRRVVENAFGILANRFRVLLTPINLSPDKVILVTQTCCALHNFIKTEMSNTVGNEADTELDDGKVVYGSWRNAGGTLQSINIRRGRPNTRSLQIREQFKIYFNNHGKVSWQENMI